MGLPEQFSYFLETFNDEEKYKNPLDILQTIVNDGLQERPLKMTDEDVAKMIERNVQFKTNDPRESYEIIS